MSSTDGQHEKHEQHDVVVVGAGPVGLLLAGQLAAGGVRVVVLERAAEPATLPKANGIVGRAAVDLARLGMLKGTGLRVVSPPRFPFGPVPLRLGFGPGNPLHVLPVPQRRLEELLRGRAIAHGAELREGVEVLGFAQDDAGADIRAGAGADEGASVETGLRAAFLVGCDGARSMVRKTAGIGFPGFTSERISRIGRVVIPAGRITRSGDGFELPGVGHVAAMRPNRVPGGGFSIAPVSALDRSAPDDLYLISTTEPRGDAVPDDAMPVDELRDSVRRVLGADLPFTEATAVRSTVGNSRQADAYRAGRVFLAGDAAHSFNAGGSALNVGLRDALELARVLHAVLRDGAPASTLDAYEAARRPAGERALRQTRAQAALGEADERSEALREVVGELARTRSGARRLARLVEEG